MGIYLNCGSGQRPFKPPFVNIECQEKWRRPTEEAGCNFTLGDVLKLPYANLSVDMVVSHHCLEHCSREEGDALVDEAYRVLRPNGSLLVFAPNLKALAQRWLMRQLSTELYMINVYGAYMGSEYDRHKQGFDPESLVAYLKRWPWAEVKPFDFRRISGADVAAHDFWIMEMECVK